ncbi:MAG: terminase small subunit [Xanthomonadaceae bacterium]|nr:terminase small subunit [Xanthomonadaceae bacterium]
MTKANGRIVSRVELAGVFGVSLTAVDAWVRRGCPCERRGRGVESEFNTAAVADWLADRAKGRRSARQSEEMDAATLRRLRAQAIALEMELKKKMNKFAPVEEVTQVLSRAREVTQQHLERAAGEAAHLLVGETDEARFDRVLRDVLTDALNAAADAIADVEAASPPPETCRAIEKPKNGTPTHAQHRKQRTVTR